LTVVSEIEERLDVLDLFLHESTAAQQLQDQLAALPDVERLLPKAAYALRALQEQQRQQLEWHASGNAVEAKDKGSINCSVPADPCDAVAAAAKQAAWRSLQQLPAALLG
jgi:hypothetical protein